MEALDKVLLRCVFEAISTKSGKFNFEVKISRAEQRNRHNSWAELKC